MHEKRKKVSWRNIQMLMIIFTVNIDIETTKIVIGKLEYVWLVLYAKCYSELNSLFSADVFFMSEKTFSTN